jgi:hypothetical protein
MIARDMIMDGTDKNRYSGDSRKKGVYTHSFDELILVQLDALTAPAKSEDN